MKNVRPRYTKPASEFGKQFITGFKRDNNDLRISLDEGREWNIKPTSKNFEIAERRMEAQNAYQVKEILPALRLDTTIDSLFTLVCISTAIITKAMDLPVKEQIEQIIHYVAGVLSIAGISLTSIDISKIKDIIKHKFFFQEKEVINSGVEESNNMLNGTSYFTRRAIAKSDDESAVTLANLGRISLNDLKAIRNNVVAQRDLQFELNDPIKRSKKKRK